MSDVGRSMRFFYHYLKRYKISFTIVIIAIIVSTYFQVKAPIYLGKAVTEVNPRDWTTISGDLL
ncbi:Lipid A export ATP-binding-permease protein MsbA [Furfurilactobacillus rossiae]|nr:Lipid A export ATP-binding-permease protein MsbA [Furfurilactobacillus rossiae]